MSIGTRRTFRYETSSLLWLRVVAATFFFPSYSLTATVAGLKSPPFLFSLPYSPHIRPGVSLPPHASSCQPPFHLFTPPPCVCAVVLFSPQRVSAFSIPVSNLFVSFAYFRLLLVHPFRAGPARSEARIKFFCDACWPSFPYLRYLPSVPCPCPLSFHPRHLPCVSAHPHCSCVQSGTRFYLAHHYFSPIWHASYSTFFRCECD